MRRFGERPPSIGPPCPSSDTLSMRRADIPSDQPMFESDPGVPEQRAGRSVSCTGLLHDLTSAARQRDQARPFARGTSEATSADAQRPPLRPATTHEACMSPSKQAHRPPQQQSRQPGVEKAMRPRPESENEEQVGSGKLRQKVALI